jgi:hypothetical protein
MKRIQILLAALIMVFSIILVPAPTQAAFQPVVKCRVKTAQAYATTKVGPAHPLQGSQRTMSLLVVVGYNSCINRLGPNFVRPVYVRATTNVSGAHMGCANGAWPYETGGHYETKFTVYFSDFVGRNFRLKTFSTPCSSNTVATYVRRISKRTSVELRVSDNDPNVHPPRARINYKVDWRSYHDNSGTMKTILYWWKP